MNDDLTTVTLRLLYDAAVFSPVQPGSPRSRVCRFVPVLSPVRKNIFAVPSRFITVCPGRHTSTPGLINQDHLGGHPFHPGGHPVHPGRHPVHPGQHTVDTRFIPVNTRFIPVNTWFITVPYGSLRCFTVYYGSSWSTHGSLRLITVHYGNSDHPSQHQVHYGSLRFIPVNTRFFQVNTRFEFSPRFDAGSSHLLKFVPGLPKIIQGSFRLVTGHPSSSRSTPGSHPVHPGSSRLVNRG